MNNKDQDDSKKDFATKIRNLNNMSIIILVGLIEYLDKEGLTAEDLFGKKVYKQFVKTKTKQRTLDILNTEDFFNILNDIGIIVKDRKEELIHFLCLDKSHSDKIHMKKLIKVLKEITINTELRECAYERCKELLNEDKIEFESNDNIEKSLQNKGSDKGKLKKKLYDSYVGKEIQESNIENYPINVCV